VYFHLFEPVIQQISCTFIQLFFSVPLFQVIYSKLFIPGYLFQVIYSKLFIPGYLFQAI